MRADKGRGAGRHGKIKGRGTPAGPNLRFSLSAHGVGVPLLSTADFQAAVRRFSRNRQSSVIPHGTVRETVVKCGVGDVF
ncbi:hypothetical protein BAR24_00470 [Gluconobacter oxydans]|nr:hypothetical protein BAR24_00470 [Gluconobacter oxydans]